MTESIIQKFNWREYLGKEFASGIGDVVTPRDIHRFALAIDDPNPIYHDENAAKKGKYGCMIAPPGYLWMSTHNSSREKRVKDLEEGGLDPDDLLGIPNLPNIWALGGVRGAEEYEFFKPVRVGDRVSVVCKLVDMYEKEGKSGKLVFVVSEHTYSSQNGEVLAKHQLTFIFTPQKETK